jgi:serine O-acetyltransferase
MSLRTGEGIRLRQLLDADWARLHAFGGQAWRRRTFRSHFNPRFATVVLIRLAQRAHARGWTPLAKLFSLINVVVFGIEVPPRLEIGPGLVIPHTHGIVIGAGAVGADVTIYQGVTFGADLADFNFDLTKRPIVEDGVIVTAGAKIIGPVRLGTRSIVGANAVVIDDIPPDMLAIGIPARARLRDRT